MDVLFLGGDKRDRTADLLNAIQALSQLSNTPNSRRPRSLAGRQRLFYHLIPKVSTIFSHLGKIF